LCRACSFCWFSVIHEPNTQLADVEKTIEAIVQQGLRETQLKLLQRWKVELQRG
jgi:hypothetical protein